MAYLHNDVLDAALQVIITNGNALHICSGLPSTYTEATSTLSLGSKASPSITGPAAGSPDGRQLTVGAISDGNVTVNPSGTASHWAIVDTTGSRLLAAGTLSESKLVTNGSVFTTTSFTVRFPAAA